MLSCEPPTDSRYSNNGNKLVPLLMLPRVLISIQTIIHSVLSLFITASVKGVKGIL